MSVTEFVGVGTLRSSAAGPGGPLGVCSPVRGGAEGPGRSDVMRSPRATPDLDLALDLTEGQCRQLDLLYAGFVQSYCSRLVAFAAWRGELRESIRAGRFEESRASLLASNMRRAHHELLACLRSAHAAALAKLTDAQRRKVASQSACVVIERVSSRSDLLLLDQDEVAHIVSVSERESVRRRSISTGYKGESSCPSSDKT